VRKTLWRPGHAAPIKTPNRLGRREAATKSIHVWRGEGAEITALCGAFCMIRFGLGLILACLLSDAAGAGEILAPGQAAKPHAENHCAALGEGFFAVNGSDACIKISGRISAGFGFGGGGGSGGSSGLDFAGSRSNGFDTEAAVSGDVRFNTGAGPGRVYVEVKKNTNPRWVIDAQ
jgi:Porin subfamily